MVLHHIMKVLYVYVYIHILLYSFGIVEKYFLLLYFIHAFDNYPSFGNDFSSQMTLLD